MGLKFYFNQKSMESLAKEFRRASWGISAIAATGGFKLDSALVALFGGSMWLLLQILAVVLESIKDERSSK
jgi:hypothetical protein